MALKTRHVYGYANTPGNDNFQNRLSILWRARDIKGYLKCKMFVGFFYFKLVRDKQTTFIIASNETNSRFMNKLWAISFLFQAKLSKIEKRSKRARMFTYSFSNLLLQLQSHCLSQNYIKLFCNFTLQPTLLFSWYLLHSLYKNVKHVCCKICILYRIFMNYLNVKRMFSISLSNNLSFTIRKIF